MPDHPRTLRGCPAGPYLLRTTCPPIGNPFPAKTTPPIDERGGTRPTGGRQSAINRLAWRLGSSQRETFTETLPEGSDGRVSIEVDPRLAHDTAIAQALALFKIVDLNNVLIKIPATLAGLPAITAVIAEGVSVNVTLIFSLERYEAVATLTRDRVRRKHFGSETGGSG